MREKKTTKAVCMPVAQALAERSLLIEKIFDATEQAQFVCPMRQGEELSFFEKRAERAYQGILEDIEQYQKIDRAIGASDASTYIETSGGTFSVMEALALKRRLDGSDFAQEELDFEENLCRKIRREYREQSAEVKQNNRQLNRMMERASLYALEQDRKHQPLLERTEAYVEAHTMLLADPLDIMERARELTKKNDRLLVELNTQIQLSNANTMIQI